MTSLNVVARRGATSGCSDVDLLRMWAQLYQKEQKIKYETPDAAEVKSIASIASFCSEAAVHKVEAPLVGFLQRVVEGEKDKRR